MNFKKISIITGHYGSGKTNVAINIALQLKRQGFKSTIVDLDIVNPYFRTADFKEFFVENGISLTASKYAGSNLDIPSLCFDLNAIAEKKDERVVIDVGGDDAGAFALGRYFDSLKAISDKEELEMYYVINAYRYLTKTTEEALDLMYEIETVSGLKCSQIINNSNLGKETTKNDVLNSLDYSEIFSKKSDLPIAFTSVKKELLPLNIKNTFPLDIMPVLI